MTNRREFLQVSAAATGSAITPTFALASPVPTCHFIHTTTLNSWPITNPAQWCLDHQHEPTLERACDGLGNLTANDADRIIRLVVRRCGLNLVEVQSNHVTVQHWSQQLADLRPLFKVSRLASPVVQVTLLDRKKETATYKTGSDFLFGQPIAQDFPIELFTSKWDNRFQRESGDHRAAPMTNSGFVWDGLEDGQIPWIALKSAWQRSQPTPCLNCYQPTILANFGRKRPS